MHAKVSVLFKNNLSFGTRQGDIFNWITYEELNKQIALLRSVLHRHHIGKNDRVALICNNRVEWAVTMYAVLGVGAQLVPMYENQHERDWRFIISDSNAKLVLVANEKIRDLVKDYPEKVGAVKSILCIECDSSYIYSYRRWMELATKDSQIPAIEVSPSDLACIVYTSGNLFPFSNLLYVIN